MLQNRLFFALASRSGFGATISDAVARSSIVFCNSVSADRIVMAASRLHRTVAAFKFGVRRAQCEVWSVRFGVWRKQWEVRSVKCGVWSVECEVSVWSAKSAVWSVKCEVWGLECEGSSEKWEVWSVKRGVWSVECEVSVWSAKSAVWSVKCEVWSVKEAVRSEKCEVWSVECEVWSLECEECSVKCGVWSVKTLLRLSLKKSNGCRGKDTVGTGCLWTIGHLCLGNFRRRLARVCYDISTSFFRWSLRSAHFMGVHHIRTSSERMDFPGWEWLKIILPQKHMVSRAEHDQYCGSMGTNWI